MKDCPKKESREAIHPHYKRRRHRISQRSPVWLHLFIRSLILCRFVRVLPHSSAGSSSTEPLSSRVQQLDKAKPSALQISSKSSAVLADALTCPSIARYNLSLRHDVFSTRRV